VGAMAGQGQRGADPWHIDWGSVASSLGSLLAVYAAGLAILIAYIALLGLGIRLLLEWGPGREAVMAIYGVALTAAWLYAWWAVIKGLRRVFISRSQG